MSRRVSPRNYKSFTARKFLQPDIGDFQDSPDHYDEDRAGHEHNNGVKTTLPPSAITDVELIQAYEEAAQQSRRVNQGQQSPQAKVFARAPLSHHVVGTPTKRAPGGAGGTPVKEYESLPRQQAGSGRSVAESLRKSTSALHSSPRACVPPTPPSRPPFSLLCPSLFASLSAPRVFSVGFANRLERGGFPTSRPSVHRFSHFRIGLWICL